MKCYEVRALNYGRFLIDLSLRTSSQGSKMAAAFRRSLLQVFRSSSPSSRQISHKVPSKRSLSLPALSAGVVTAAAAWYYYEKAKNNNVLKPPTLLAKELTGEGHDESRPITSHRERRFLTFASIEYEGNVYMTPQDFLESVTEEIPRPRTARKPLSVPEYDSYIYNTPSRRRANNRFFRTLHQKGLISYTEYLFLLCVLTKPQSGFRIAFNMFDTDGNEKVDKKEFLVLEKVLSASKKAKEEERRGVKEEKEKEEELERIFSVQPSEGDSKEELQEKADKNVWRGKSIISSKTQEAAIQSEDEPEVPIQDTTLLTFFFGRKGKDVLTYDDFARFMDNLQTEVLELEFNEFSKGMQTISEIEFARILLRYTIFGRDEHEQYLTRLAERMPQEKGITFDQFKQFCQFLNNLDNFAIAMRMYTFADQPVCQEEFQRAVKVCTGYTLDPHVVNTVFQLFDIDGDGNLSHEEFITKMKDRLHRGFRSHLQNQTHWDTFRSCVKNEMRKS